MQLKADLDTSYDDSATNDQRCVILKLQIRKQDVANHNQPNSAFRLSGSCFDTGNMKPPCRVPTILVSAINLSLTFSSQSSGGLLSRKRPRSESEGFLDLFDKHTISNSGMLRYKECTYQYLEDEENLWQISQRLNRTTSSPVSNAMSNKIAPTLNRSSSNGAVTDLLNGVSEINSEDTESIAFSSQGSTLPPSQHSPFKRPSNSNSAFSIPSIISLTDAALRNLVCQKPIRTAPGVKTDVPAFEATLTDIAPSTFCPGYGEAVAARAPLVPTIARFLTSFMQKSNSESVSTKRGALLREPAMKQSACKLEGAQGQDQETELKDVVKLHLWMTMTKGLRNQEPARRLKPLQLSTNANCYQDGTVHPENIDQANDGFYDILDQGSYSWIQNPWTASTCATASEDDEMLHFDEEDEADDYDQDLFDMYEERLRHEIDHTNSSTLDVGDHEKFNFLEGSSTSNHSADMLTSSPVLEMQNSPSQSRSADEEVRISIEQAPDPPPSVKPGTAQTCKNIDDHDTVWISMIEDEDHSAFRVADEQQTVSNSIIMSSEDDWEPDFEQWEFDVEQGSDEMLF